MAAGLCRSSRQWLGIWTFVIWILAFCSQVRADDTQLVPFTTDEGTVYLDNNRQPALYTGAFGDCQGDSLINVTRFDASLYRDNMTVMFHLAGSTALKGEHVMMYFSVYAYGENRFSLTFNPCVINIPSMCPLNASIPVEANGLIPIGPADLAGIPSIAFQIPDFEGQAILRLFSNTTQSQIACYSAKLGNGHTFSHPAAVGSVLGFFAVIALISSVAVAVYGQFVPEMRTHYAHGISVFVVFSVFQHIFFSGALSMNWPSVLVAFWSNYGWTAGMIYSKAMQNTINQFIGSNRGNISMVGSAPSNQNSPNVGGGFQLSQIYKRDLPSTSPNMLHVRSMEHMLNRRQLPNSTSGFSWYGSPVAPGLPLPGNYSGFAGTLATLDIPASNSFLTGLFWLLALIGAVAAAMVVTKAIIEILAKIKMMKTTRLDFFRAHWIQYTTSAVLRTCFIAFFMMMYLTLFQMVLGGATKTIALAAIVFIVFLLGMLGVAGYALWYRLNQSKLRLDADNVQIVSRKHGPMPWYGVTRENTERTKEQPQRVVKNFPWKRPRLAEVEERQHVHDDEGYTTRFGWLSARFRRSRWWFFSAWLIYELGRACFYGGAAGHPLIQVFGLLAWEIIAFIATIIFRPFESNRLNMLMVYFLGFSKVASVALSCAFDPRFGLGRILTTVIGVIIIVIQGFLTIGLLIAIMLGAISSYMSITRNHETFKPASWTKLRDRYFDHVAVRATDKPRPPPPPPPPEPEKPKGPYFAVSSVRREPKIEDEDPNKEIFDEVYEVEAPLEAIDSEETIFGAENRAPSRVGSVRSRTSTSNLPYGARQVRRSWSVRELANQSTEYIPSVPGSRMSTESTREPSKHRRVASMRETYYSTPPGAENDDWQMRRHRRIRSTSNPQGPSRKSAVVSDTNEIQRTPFREE